jgi:hypothetical protein
VTRTPLSTKWQSVWRWCVLGALLWPSVLKAQPGPYFDSAPEPEQRYEIELSASYQFATRDEFRSPVLLLPHVVRRIRAQQLTAELDFRVSVTPRIALQAVVPLALREVELELGELVVSADQVLPGVRRSLSSFGVLDPTLDVSYRFYSGDVLDVFADAGTRIPLDDNPESLTFPARVPLSTGQHELFLGAGANLRFAGVSVAFDYRFGYLPGNTATYLIRRFDDQSYTNGALAAHVRHRVRAALGVGLSSSWSLHLRPEWSVLRTPELVEVEGTRRFAADDWLDELSTRLSLRYRFDERHSIELFYDHAFFEAFEHDPFFPIVIPQRCGGFAWRVWSL